MFSCLFGNWGNVRDDFLFMFKIIYLKNIKKMKIVEIVFEKFYDGILMRL